MDANGALNAVPPNNMEAEQWVLGGMLLDEDALDTVLTILNRDSFYSERNQCIFDSIVRCYRENGYVDLVMVRLHLEAQGLLDKVGGIGYLMEVEESVLIACHTEYYAKVVHELAVRRKLCDMSLRCISNVYNGIESLDIMKSVEGDMSQIISTGNSSSTSVLGTVADIAFDRINAAKEHVNQPTGISTGLVDLDNYTGGLCRGELCVIAARPSMGKTSLVLNIMLNIAACDMPLLFFSLETSAEQIGHNMLCIESRQDSHAARNGRLRDTDQIRLASAKQKIGSYPILINDQSIININELTMCARKYKTSHDIGVVIVDYLQLLDVGEARREYNRQQEITLISRRLKAITKDIDVSVVVLSQLNRLVEHRDGNKPRLSDLRESGAIEQDADTVILLHRPEYYNKDSSPGIAILHIAKQRNGPTGSVQVSFQAQCLKFANLEIGHSLTSYSD